MNGLEAVAGVICYKLWGTSILDITPEDKEYCLELARAALDAAEENVGRKELDAFFKAMYAECNNSLSVGAEMGVKAALKKMAEG